VPALVHALADEEWHVTANAAMALGAIGPGAAPAIPGLTAALAHEEANVRLNAAYALGQIDPQNAEGSAALQRLVHDDADARVRQMAETALQKAAATQ
jgi:HEAT repeat protein